MFCETYIQYIIIFIIIVFLQFISLFIFGTSLPIRQF